MTSSLTIAVCICDDVFLSDFITPMELISTLNEDHTRLGLKEAPPVRVEIDYLAPTMDPVRAMRRLAPTINPTLTYASALAAGKQFDILWLPAGKGPDGQGRHTIPDEEIAFIAQQALGAKYVMSVCTGSFQLALAGALSGKRATTNKSDYHLVTASTPKDIQWVPSARWVVDGNVWTSSGVTAGSDMAVAFLAHIAGVEFARTVRGIFEIPEVTEKDDPFAAWYGLV
ncbi:class I glutamine amidotransferase-like protein [Roridomyces roridus]|uniref:Class I glutamine amidotransferase-like protein n=1 Tax=Roridomyces roridus TaxID=1738132 RepID=A0AAD7CGJ4_9AGAR|nr:class I glutamine amidotransferase-like protein [Roridomyces roridus]